MRVRHVVGIIDVRYVSAICVNPSHISTSRGKSSMFPISGRPLGPGGYGSLGLLREPRDMRYLASAIREMVAPAGMTKRESVSVSLSMVKRTV